MKKTIFIVLCLILCQTGYTNAQPLSNEEFAIVQFEKEIKDNPKDMGSHMALCQLYGNTNDYSKMLRFMETIINRFKKNPTIPKVFNNYAKKYYEEKNFLLAEKIAKLTYTKFKDDPDTAFILSKILLMNKKYNEAISILKDSIEKHNDALFLYDTVIDVYLIKQDYKSAFKYAQLAHEKNFGNLSYYFLEALSLQNIEKNKAVSYYEAYLNKLKFAKDYEYRIIAAKKILQLLTKNGNVESYIDLLNYLTKLKAPPSHIIVQARYAKNLFPNNSFFDEIIQKNLNNP